MLTNNNLKDCRLNNCFSVFLSQRLQAMGVKIYKQKLSMIFSNPFYCGILVHKMLDGALIEGVHEKMISQELFLQVNQVRQAAQGKYGITHKKEIEETPLKLFVKCDECGQPVTGYIVQKKNIHYYKCRTIGCCNNKNAKKLNEAFTRHLSQYALPDHLTPVLQEVVYTLLDKHTTSLQEQSTSLKARLTELQKKMDILDEKYYIDSSIPTETYEKLQQKMAREKLRTVEKMTSIPENCSNLKHCFDL